MRRFIYVAAIGSNVKHVDVTGNLNPIDGDKVQCGRIISSDNWRRVTLPDDTRYRRCKQCEAA